MVPNNRSLLDQPAANSMESGYREVPLKALNDHYCLKKKKAEPSGGKVIITSGKVTITSGKVFPGLSDSYPTEKLVDNYPKTFQLCGASWYNVLNNCSKARAKNDRGNAGVQGDRRETFSRQERG